MTFSHFLHATTPRGWAYRLVAYVLGVIALVVLVQLLAALWIL